MRCAWCREPIEGRPVVATFGGGLRVVDGGWTNRLAFHGAAMRPRAGCYGAFVAAVSEIMDSRAARGRVALARSEADADMLERGERWQMHRAWRASDTFRQLIETWRGVPVSPGVAHRLADAGYDPSRAATASDAELLAVKGVGEASLAALRRHAGVA